MSPSPFSNKVGFVGKVLAKVEASVSLSLVRVAFVERAGRVDNGNAVE